MTSDYNAEITVLLHKYTYDYNWEKFADVLKEMGLASMFTSSATFGNISHEDIVVSKDLHKTHIKLNEKGTKTSAVTLKEQILVRDKKYNICFFVRCMNLICIKKIIYV